MLKIGSKVKAARVFRNPDFRFEDVRKVVGIVNYESDVKEYVIDGKPDVLYVRRDLVEV